MPPDGRRKSHRKIIKTDRGRHCFARNFRNRDRNSSSINHEMCVPEHCVVHRDFVANLLTTRCADPSAGFRRISRQHQLRGALLPRAVRKGSRYHPARPLRSSHNVSPQKALPMRMRCTAARARGVQLHVHRPHYPARATVTHRAKRSASRHRHRTPHPPRSPRHHDGCATETLSCGSRSTAPRSGSHRRTA